MKKKGEGWFVSSGKSDFVFTQFQSGSGVAKESSLGCTINESIGNQEHAWAEC